ncbi:hypothetical protein KR032_002472 [Drosophila birchii]|nr:hypothetical protein KR032_002472 [Drosophila birchii]
MKLLSLLWLLCGLLLVVGDQDPPVAAAPKAPIAGNVTVSTTLGNATAAVVGATGTPIAAGSPADKAQTNNQSPPKATKIEQQTKEAEKIPAVPENVAKNRKRTDTDNPKPAGNATVNASTPKPAGVETKASTAAVAAAPSAPAPAPSSKPNDKSTASPTAAKTATINTAKPTAGSAIVSEGQSMKDVTKANNATSHQLGKNNNTATVTATSTTASTKSTSTTTPKPTKPKVVFSMGTHTEWEQKQDQGKAGDKPPLPKPASTLAEPMVPQVQELTGTQANRSDTSYVVPIVTVLLTVPLAIGVVTIMYRRFRYMWSTRHYRRMDFLVDGMYND